MGLFMPIYRGSYSPAHDPAGGGGGGDANTETTAWANAVTGDGGTINSTHRSAIDTFITSAKSNGYFSKLDRLWVFKAANSQSALRDIVAAAQATATSSPTFTTTAGYAGNGSSAYIDSNFNPTTAGSPKFTQDSACLFAWSNTSGSEGGAIAGNAGGGGHTYMYPKFVDTGFYSGCQDSGYAFVNSHLVDGIGFFACNRSNSSSEQAYVNGGADGTTTSNTSVSIHNSTLRFLSGDTTFTSRVCLAGGFGQSLTSTEHGNLYTDLNTLLAAIT